MKGLQLLHLPDTPTGYRLADEATMGLSAESRDKAVARLKRAEGQLAAVRRMLESDSDCVDTLLQLSAVRGALSRVGEMVLSAHIETCVTQALRSGDDDCRQGVVDELMEVFARYGGIGGR